MSSLFSIRGLKLKKRKLSVKVRDQRESISNEKNELSPTLPPLKQVILPRVHPHHHLALSDQGWTTIGLSQNRDDALHSSFLELLEAGETFFDLPQEQKEQYRTLEGTEDGWSAVPGEKEFITLRTLDNTPDGLRNPASLYWAAAGSLLNETLARVAESMNLPADALTAYSEPCSKLTDAKTATMLRIFRYEGYSGHESKVVAEAHRDLGLLSLVIGDIPGLEVWDKHAEFWFPIEKSYKSPAASLLVGRQLERLSNGRYIGGGHLVRSYPEPATKRGFKKSASKKKYRYSIVFVLRAHSPVPVNTDELTTNITGEFAKPIRDMTAGDLFRQIHRAHFNINTNIPEREEQRRRLAIKQEDQGFGTTQ